MTAWKIWVALHKACSGVVVIRCEDYETDPGIDRPVLVSVNLAGSIPQWPAHFLSP